MVKVVDSGKWCLGEVHDGYVNIIMVNDDFMTVNNDEQCLIMNVGGKSWVAKKRYDFKLVGIKSMKQFGGKFNMKDASDSVNPQTTSKSIVKGLRLNNFCQHVQHWEHWVWHAYRV